MSGFGTLPLPFLGLPGGAPWITAGDIVNNTLARVKQPMSSDPFNDTGNVNVTQMVALLVQAGKEVLYERVWTHLTQQAEFVTIQGTSTYPLPPDFGRMINQTGWNRSTRLPIGGPLSEQEWAYLKGVLVGVTFTVLFKPYQRQLVLYPDVNTPGGYDIAYAYVSRNWVQHDLTTTFPDAEAPTASSDIIWFEPELMIRALKLAWLRENKLESTAAQQDYDRRLEQAMGIDSYDPILDLSQGAGGYQVPLIGQQSVPITGFGG